MRENKMEFIKELEKLCNKTRALENLVIEPGYFDYRSGEFVPSEEKVNHLCIHWKDQDRQFGRVKSIEGDSCYGILIDAMKVISRLG